MSDNIIQITREQAQSIHFFIRFSLECAWDRYTDRYICEMSEEDGMRRMNPEMYDFAEELEKLLEKE